MIVLYTFSILVLCGMFQTGTSLSRRTTTTPYSTTTTNVPEKSDGQTLPECKFDLPLDPSLVCRRLDTKSQEQYTPNQKFCACPSFSECMIRDIPDPDIQDYYRTIFICDRDSSNDPEWRDMTHGLLREKKK